MNIIIAPGSLKGSLNNHEFALAVETGCKLALPNANIVRIPMADGGDGTLESFIADGNTTIYHVEVNNPAGHKILAPLGIKNAESNNRVAIIEIAKASGLSITPPDKRRPLDTSSYGSGELIRAALDLGCLNFIVGLGGSATCDGGVGALAALGAQFKNSENQEISYTARGLQDLSHIDISKIDPRLHLAKFILACDVNNPLLGSNGASLYVTQKGATQKDAEQIRKNLIHFTAIVENQFKKTIGTIPYGGAAGGMAAGLFAFLNAELKPGALVVMKEIHLEQKIKKADFIITGEGRLDKQSLHGKTPIAIAQLAKKYSIPVIAIVATLGSECPEIYDQGIAAVFSFANGPMTKYECLRLTKPLLSNAAYNITRLLSLKLRTTP